MLSKDYFSAIFYQIISKYIAWPIHQGVKKHFQSHYLNHPRIRILDVGCGTGAYQLLFAETNYIGMDISYHRLRIAKLSNKGQYVCQSVANLAFYDHYFDRVFCANMIHHLDDAAFVKMLKELKRVTKDGGQIIIYDIYRSPNQRLVTRLAHWADRGCFIRQIDRITKVFDEGLPGYKISFLKNGVLDFYHINFVKKSVTQHQNG